MTWITPPAYKPGEANGAVLANLIGGGKASRLYKKLVYEMRIAQDVSAQHNALLLGSLFQITATAKPGHTPEELEKAIDAELAKLVAQGPSDAEVEASRQTIYSNTVASLERVGWFNGVADRLNQYNYYLKDPNYLDKDLARYVDVTPATAKRFANQYLTKNARVVVYGVPGEKVLGAAVPTPPAPQAAEAPKVEDREPWRATPPVPAKDAARKLPVPTRFTLANGLTVYHLEDHSLPLVTAGLVFRTGSSADPVDLQGLSALSYDMVEEGTEKFSSLAMADKLHSLGATWQGAFDTDSG